MGYLEADKARALEIYRLNDRNLSLTSELTGISRPTLVKWKHRGDPVELTGGVDWDTYLDAQDAYVMEISLKPSEEYTKQAIERVKSIVSELIEIGYEQMKSKGVTVRAGDLTKLIKLSLSLEETHEEKILFMKEVVVDLLDAAADICDEGQLIRLQNRFYKILDNKRRKLLNENN